MIHISTLYTVLKKGAALSFLGLLLCFALSQTAFSQPLVIEKGSITSDTVWEGEVLIKADVEIAKGATLTIMPGTIVKFEKIEQFGPGKLYKEKTHQFPRAELIIRGKIIAKGTKEQMITFTSAAPTPAAGDWGAVNILDSVDNILEYCDMSYAHTAIHTHGGQFIAAYCYIHDSGVAIGQKNFKGFSQSKIIVHDNLLTTNGGGLLSGGGGIMTATNNNIVNNELFGIFGKKANPASEYKFNNITKNGKGIILYAMGNFSIQHNNINDNLEYNMSLLEGQTEDIDARNNWWGSTDEKKIKALLRDKDEDASLGTIIFSDYEKAPIAEACITK